MTTPDQKPSKNPRPRRRLPVGWIILAAWVLLFAGVIATLVLLWSGWQESLYADAPQPPPDQSAAPR